MSCDLEYASLTTLTGADRATLGAAFLATLATLVAFLAGAALLDLARLGALAFFTMKISSHLSQYLHIKSLKKQWY